MQRIQKSHRKHAVNIVLMIMRINGINAYYTLANCICKLNS